MNVNARHHRHRVTDSDGNCEMTDLVFEGYFLFYYYYFDFGFFLCGIILTVDLLLVSTNAF